MELKLNKPIKLNELFTIPTDDSQWDCSYTQPQNYPFEVPNRIRVLTSNRGLVPLNQEIEDKLRNESGFWIIISTEPSVAFHIGFSRNDLLIRIQNARILLTGSNAGQSVSHANVVRSYAIDRYNHFKSQDKPDNLNDCYLITGQIKNIEEFENRNLEYLKRLIVRGEDIVKEITSKVLDKEVDNISTLVSPRKLNNQNRPNNLIIKFWDDKVLIDE